MEDFIYKGKKIKLLLNTEEKKPIRRGTFDEPTKGTK